MQAKLKRVFTPVIRKVFSIFLFALVIASLCFILLRAFRFMDTTGLTPTVVFRLLVDDGAPLASSNHRTNILLMGVGGGNHDGADLTDTMIVLSLDTKNKKAALISIPRDIWSDTLKDKINSAYHYGEQKEKGGGLVLSRVIDEDVIGMPIQYSVLIDFSGFKNVIDLMGGITVHVSQTFTDTQYPIPGKEHYTCPGDPTNQCDYETVHFDAGTQRMDGNTALIYVRSRHAEGSEGSDFARSRRQQEVLVALQDKLAHPQTWATYQRLLALPQALKTATSTDMNIGELLTVGKQLLHVKQSNIERISFESTLTQPPDYLYGGLFVLVPKEDWDSVHTYILQKLEFDR